MLIYLTDLLGHRIGQSVYLSPARILPTQRETPPRSDSHVLIRRERQGLSWARRPD